MQIYNIPIDRHGKELTALGTEEFPVGVYKTQLNKNILGYINWHWHEAIQLCLITKGYIRVNIHRKEYILHEGEGCFIHTNVLHMIRPEKDPDSTYICINVTPQWISGGKNNILYNKYIHSTIDSPGFRGMVLHPNVFWEKEILNNIQQIYDADCAKYFGYEWDIMIALQRIWRNIILSQEKAAHPISSTKESGDLRLKDLLSFLHNNYTEKLTLEQIASIIHLCPGECCRFFKRNMGKTIFQYLAEYRIEQSIRDLTQTSKLISEIAYEHGFSSTSHYIDRFKKHTGITPLEYRKKVKSI